MSGETSPAEKAMPAFSGMTWSFSRISTYARCPYLFFLTYLSGEPMVETPLFYSDFGSFMHELLASYYKGERTAAQLASDYISGFRLRVLGYPPSADICRRWFSQGLACLRRLEPPEGDVVGVEKRLKFEVGGRRFLGFADLITRSGDDFTIIDHKSRDLKPRSSRKTPTKSDEELDAYLRQLYLYASAVEAETGFTPKELAFNCYRTGVLIREPFRREACDAAKAWALDAIAGIERTESWKPNLDYYHCNYICPFHRDCEYYAMEFSRR